MGIAGRKNIYFFYISNNALWRYYPNSVLALANPLLEAGFNPFVIDTVLEGCGEINLEDPLFIGLSMYTDENIATALDIARRVRKKYPGVPIAWGGPHVIMVPEQTAKNPLVDFVCYGEGEISVVGLARGLAAGRDSFQDVPGIIWKDRFGKGIKNSPAPQSDMDEFELYPYQLLNEKVYKLKHGKIYYEASRGCPYGCKFCSYDHTRWRKRSPEKVISDLECIEKTYQPEEVQIIDSNHFIDIAWTKKIWAAKISRGLKFKWESNIRFDILAKIDDETLDILSRSKCQLRLGAESGSQDILNYLNKGITVEQILKGIQNCTRYGINPVISFMIGYPPEKDKDIYATMELINLIEERFPGTLVNALYQFQPFPNTKIFKEISKTYKIPQPEDLEGWAEYNIVRMRRSVFPWMSAHEYRRANVLNSIVSYRWFSYRLKSMPAAQRKSIPLFNLGFFLKLFILLDFIIRKTFVYLRWEKRIMAFPVEWYIWNFIRAKIVKMY